MPREKRAPACTRLVARADRTDTAEASAGDQRGATPTCGRGSFGYRRAVATQAGATATGSAVVAVVGAGLVGELAIQRLPRDPEHLSGERLVAAGRLHHALHVAPLDL